MKPPALLDRASPAVAAAAGWMAGRSRREQVLLAVLGGFLTVAALWLLLLRPLQEARTMAVDRIAAYETVMVRVRTAGGAAGPMAQPLTGPLETAIPVQAATFGVVPTVTPDGDAVLVTVTEARYDSLVPWLAALEASGAALSSVRIERGSQPGAVDLSMRLEP